MVTVADCWKFYEQTHLGVTASPEKTKARWKALSWFADMDAESITLDDVKAYIAFRNLKPGTINRDLAMLNAVIRHAWKAGKIAKLPFIQKLPAPPSSPKYLTKEQAQKIIDAAKEDTWQTLVFVMIGLSSGARTGAILDLTWDRVGDAVDFRATDALASRRKGRAVVPMNDTLKAALDIAREHKNGDYVLHNKGKKLPAVQGRIERVAKRAGIPWFSAHVMRHTVVSILLQDGGDMLQVSRLIGHKNSKTTESVYFHYKPDWLRPLSEKLKFS